MTRLLTHVNRHTILSIVPQCTEDHVSRQLYNKDHLPLGWLSGGYSTQRHIQLQGLCGTSARSGFQVQSPSSSSSSSYLPSVLKNPLYKVVFMSKNSIKSIKSWLKGLHFLVLKVSHTQLSKMSSTVFKIIRRLYIHANQATIHQSIYIHATLASMYIELVVAAS